MKLIRVLCAAFALVSTTGSAIEPNMMQAIKGFVSLDGGELKLKGPSGGSAHSSKQDCTIDLKSSGDGSLEISAESRGYTDAEGNHIPGAKLKYTIYQDGDSGPYRSNLSIYNKTNDTLQIRAVTAKKSDCTCHAQAISLILRKDVTGRITGVNVNNGNQFIQCVVPEKGLKAQALGLQPDSESTDVELLNGHKETVEGHILPRSN